MVSFDMLKDLRFLSQSVEPHCTGASVYRFRFDRIALFLLLVIVTLFISSFAVGAQGQNLNQTSATCNTSCSDCWLTTSTPRRRSIGLEEKHICRTNRLCDGDSSNLSLPIQQYPLQIQNGDSVELSFSLGNTTWQLYETDSKGFQTCNFSATYRNYTGIHSPSVLIPASALSPGVHFFIGRAATGPRVFCTLGLRIRITVTKEDCNFDNITKSLCSGKGLCRLQQNSTEYKCQCCNEYGNIFCSEFNGCLSRPCQNGGNCSDIVAGHGANFTCNCGPFFTGQRCESVVNYCSSVPCHNNGTCTNIPLEGRYKCNCTEGFNGTDCEINVNDCASHLCSENSTCIDGINGYKCACYPGWTGNFCRIDINECIQGVCLNNGNCTNFAGNFSCQCLSGFTGRYCETDLIDQCLSSPCQNNGTCTDLVGAYQCQCKKGYNGTRCELDVNECNSNPCRIDGTVQCIDLPADFRCVCRKGYTGKSCDKLVNFCIPDPCVNGGLCVSSLDKYECACPAGFVGKNCEEIADKCSYKPCKNQGTCIRTGDYLRDYVCTCRPGWTGRNCTVNIDECISSPCLNNGTCHDGINGYNCTCFLGWRGTHCEVNIDVCKEKPCQNDANCTDLQTGLDYLCHCLPGYSGKNCSHNIDECRTLNINCNNGRCIDLINGHLCNCTEGWYGDFCDTDRDICHLKPCQNGAKCHNINTTSGYKCNCQPGFTGVNCSININECSSQPCKHNGTCNDFVNYFNCSCLAGFTGRFCETEINECFSNPCKNNGTCIDNIGSFSCHCVPGYTGYDCSQEINECKKNPCLNNGTCIDGINMFTCNCTGGYFGGMCQIPICSKQPCKNGSTCVQKIDGYQCNCLPGFTGRHCNIDINECAPKPCLNNGQCVDKVNGYECNCSYPFSGKTCSEHVCDSGICLNQGNCTKLQSGYKCSCPMNFNGTRCEIPIGPCSSNPCAYNSTCIENGSTFTCKCSFGFDGYRCLNARCPCQNTGRCMVGAYGITYCQCPVGYSGPLCEHFIGDCRNYFNSSLACLNNKQCTSTKYGYICKCPPAFIGAQCKIFGGCVRQPCRNGGTCSGNIGEIKCTCTPRFTGQFCELDLNECLSNPCQNGGTCREKHSGGFICFCSSGFYGSLCQNGSYTSSSFWLTSSHFSHHFQTAGNISRNTISSTLATLVFKSSLSPQISFYMTTYHLASSEYTPSLNNTLLVTSPTITHLSSQRPSVTPSYISTSYQLLNVGTTTISRSNSTIQNLQTQPIAHSFASIATPSTSPAMARSIPYTQLDSFTVNSPVFSQPTQSSTGNGAFSLLSGSKMQLQSNNHTRMSLRTLLTSQPYFTVLTTTFSSISSVFLLPSGMVTHSSWITPSTLMLNRTTSSNLSLNKASMHTLMPSLDTIMQSQGTTMSTMPIYTSSSLHTTRDDFFSSTVAGFQTSIVSYIRGLLSTSSGVFTNVVASLGTSKLFSKSASFSSLSFHSSQLNSTDVVKTSSNTTDISTPSSLLSHVTGIGSSTGFGLSRYSLHSSMASPSETAGFVPQKSSNYFGVSSSFITTSNFKSSRAMPYNESLIRQGHTSMLSSPIVETAQGSVRGSYVTTVLDSTKTHYLSSVISLQHASQRSLPVTMMTSGALSSLPTLTVSSTAEFVFTLPLITKASSFTTGQTQEVNTSEVFMLTSISAQYTSLATTSPTTSSQVLKSNESMVTSLLQLRSVVSSPTEVFPVSNFSNSSFLSGVITSYRSTINPSSYHSKFGIKSTVSTPISGMSISSNNSKHIRHLASTVFSTFYPAQTGIEIISASSTISDSIKHMSVGDSYLMSSLMYSTALAQTSSYVSYRLSEYSTTIHIGTISSNTAGEKTMPVTDSSILSADTKLTEVQHHSSYYPGVLLNTTSQPMLLSTMESSASQRIRTVSINNNYHTTSTALLGSLPRTLHLNTFSINFLPSFYTNKAVNTVNESLLVSRTISELVYSTANTLEVSSIFDISSMYYITPLHSGSQDTSFTAHPKSLFSGTLRQGFVSSISIKVTNFTVINSFVMGRSSTPDLTFQTITPNTSLTMSREWSSAAHSCQSRPCLNGGICMAINDGLTHRCICKLGFVGKECEKYQCPCHNEGRCVLRSDGEYKCLCKVGFNGTLCETFIGDCRSYNCSNRGTCRVRALDGYTCHCDPSFHGERCEKNSTNCTPDPCQNGGICFIASNITQEFKCLCPPGYQGQFCQFDFNECGSNPCLNNGTCREDQVNTFTCICPSGASGNQCELLATSSLTTSNHRASILSMSTPSQLMETSLMFLTISPPSYDLSSKQTKINNSSEKRIQTTLTLPSINRSSYFHISVNASASTHIYSKPLVTTSSFSTLVKASIFETSAQLSTLSSDELKSSNVLTTSMSTILPQVSTQEERALKSSLIMSSVSIEGSIFVSSSPFPRSTVTINTRRRIVLTTSSIGSNYGLTTNNGFSTVIMAMHNSTSYHSNTSPVDLKSFTSLVSPTPVPTPTSTPNRNLTCEESPCNRYTCINETNFGLKYRCVCPYPTLGARCNTGIVIHFPLLAGNSYVRYDGITFANTLNSIVLTFRSTTSSGLLVYAGHTTHKDFVQLVLVSQKVEFLFNTGGTTVSLRHPTTIKLGDLVTVIARYDRRTKTGTLSINGTSPISKQINSVLTSIQISTPWYVGGIPASFRPVMTGNPSPFVNFTGCIRDLQINEKPLRMLDAKDWLSIRECDLAACARGPCKNNATCVQNEAKPEDYQCNCGTGYFGPDCTHRQDHCKGDPCNGGICAWNPTGYTCLCQYGRHGITCNSAINITVPTFGVVSNYSSFIEYPWFQALRLAAQRLEISLQFTLNQGTDRKTKDGLIAFAGQSTIGAKSDDFLALGIYQNHTVLIYNLGGGVAVLTSKHPIQDDRIWHRLVAGRRGREGYIHLDDNPVISGNSPGVLVGLDVYTPLYIGGVPDFSKLPDYARAYFTSGFSGSIHDMSIRTSQYHFIPLRLSLGSRVASSSSGISVERGLNVGDDALDECQSQPCANNGTCTSIGSQFQCTCVPPWKGVLCRNRVLPCVEYNPCSPTSDCVVEGATVRCDCALGKTGEFCDQAATIELPLFQERSFLALKAVNIKSTTDVYIRFKSTQGNGLLFYVSESIRSSTGDFFVISLLNRQVQVRFNLGGSTGVLKSRNLIDLNRWHTVTVRRGSKQAIMRLDNNGWFGTTTSQSFTILGVSSLFYLGGVPMLSSINPKAKIDVASQRDFKGCISTLTVNNQAYNLSLVTGRVGRNIGNCGGKCDHDTCANGATCVPETISRAKNYSCACTAGWEGDRCDVKVIGNQTSGKFGGKSYVYYQDDNKGPFPETYLKLSFNTTKDGLLIWFGQLRSGPQDYLSLGVKNGLLRLSFSMGSKSTEKSPSINVTDGKVYEVTVRRIGKTAVLTLDRPYLVGVTSTVQTMNSYGITYIGGVDGDVKALTNGQYTSGFIGCISNLQLSEGGQHFNFNQVALKSRDVGKCS